MYKKARAGQIKDFTGIDSPYEAPEAAEIIIKNINISVHEAADLVINYLEERGYLKPAESLNAAMELS